MKLPALFAVAAALSAPAHAALVAVAESDAGRLDFFTDRGPICVGKAMRVQFVPRQGPAMEGCWLPGPGMLRAVFTDGDVLELPLSELRPPKSV